MAKSIHGLSSINDIGLLVKFLVLRSEKQLTLKKKLITLM